MIIITGASDNHYLTLINMIKSFVIFNNNEHKLIVYNLGIAADKWIHLQDKNNSNISYKTFDYSQYPDWFNINIRAGHYAWKPTIIYNTWVANEKEIIVWMDAGNLILNNLNQLEHFITLNGIYSSETNEDIKKWTHPATIQYMNCTWINERNRNGACMGFNTKIDYVKEFLTEFYNYSQIKDCICPAGSSRENHRQDQAVFTVLFYKYIMKYKFSASSYSIDYSIHNDEI